jgi:hypothetical protein
MTSSSSTGGGGQGGGTGGAGGLGGAGGAGGTGGGMCMAGKADCDPNIAGCETDIANDAKNCNGCGNVCPTPKVGQAACSNSQCSYIPLATGLNAPNAMAIDATYVYWAEQGSNDLAVMPQPDPNAYKDGSIKRVPIAGGAVDTLASAEYDPYGLVADANNIYWTSWGSGEVRRLAKNAALGTKPTVMATGLSLSFAPQLAVDGTNLYFTEDKGNRVIERLPINAVNGAPAAVVTTTGYPYALAVDATSIYWSENTFGSPNVGKVFRADLANGANQKVVGSAEAFASGVTVAGGTAYYGDSPDGNGNGAKVWSAPAAGGGAHTLLNPGFGVSTNLIATDASNVYVSSYSNNAGSCQRQLLAGGSEFAYTSGGYFGVGVAVDANFIYWVSEGDHSPPGGPQDIPLNKTGAILRAPK